MPPVLFALVIFQVESNVFAQAKLDHNSPIYISHSAGLQA
jgi:hypothetical protein